VDTLEKFLIGCLVVAFVTFIAKTFTDFERGRIKDIQYMNKVEQCTFALWGGHEKTIQLCMKEGLIVEKHSKN